MTIVIQLVYLILSNLYHLFYYAMLVHCCVCVCTETTEGKTYQRRLEKTWGS